MLLWGESDRVKPLAQADTWLKLVADARLETMPGVGHLPLDEQPAAAAEIISNFLKEKPGAAKPAALTAAPIGA